MPEPATQAAAARRLRPSRRRRARRRPQQPSSRSRPPTEPAAPHAGNGRGAAEHHFVSPVVARIAAEHGIDPAQIEGTGRGGRVTKKDILAYVESGAAAPAPAAAPEPRTRSPAAPAPPPAAPPAPRRTRRAAPAAASVPDAPELGPGESIEPMSAMRKGIADHMRRSLDTSAHVTSAIEVDMSKVVAVREKLKREYQSTYGVNPTYLSFIARATVETIRDWPWVNAEIRGASIVTKRYVNLGVAVSLEGGKGLIVPVLKNVEGMNLLGIARGIADLAERARTKKLTPDDVQGGTFTLTNPGGFGTFHGTPIISQPQSAILGTYALVKRPWVVTDDAGNDAIAIRPMMNITLTYDHRLVDGAYGAQFLAELREKLESWDEGAY